jgi:hypothetical protein
MGRVADELVAGLTELAADLEAGRPVPATVLARVMPRCTFVVRDCFELLDSVKDEKGVGVYCDPPFPDAGDAYRHRFSEDQHRRLASKLSGFQKARCVCRFYRHPLIEELYPAPRWRWLELEGGRTQTNASAPEVLLVNGEPLIREEAL